MTGNSILGRAFALADGQQQAEFLNEAGKMLHRACEADEYKLDTQAACIVDGLDQHGRALVCRIAAFITSDKDAPRRWVTT